MFADALSTGIVL